MLRATLKSLLSRKLRLALAAFSVVLGVAFVSGAYVLTDSMGARFDNLFDTIGKDVSVLVQQDERSRELGESPTLTQEQLDTIKANTPGAAQVIGNVSVEGAIPIKKSGKAVRSQGAPQFAFSRDPDDDSDLMSISEGHAPRAEGEVALTRYTAKQAGAKVNEKFRVYVPRLHEIREFTVVGIYVYSGNRDSLGGETAVIFPVAEAQKIFLGKEGLFTDLTIKARAGVSDDTLKAQVVPHLPPAFEAQTSAEFTKKQSSDVKEGLKFVTWFFLVFGAIALLVGTFLIFNTFNILVAQRSKELALFRALGAGWGQVVRSVLVEAIAVGLLGSTIGLGGGYLLGVGLQALMGNLLFELPEGPNVMALRTVLLAYGIGVIVTVVAALIPALKASRVPPIAAMRDVVRPDKPLKRLFIAGAVLAGLGALGVGLALNGLGDATLPALGGGVLFIFLGMALLSPVIVRPLAGMVGKLVSWGPSSRLGRRNSLRNPRRTATTAAALMIGVALVSGISVLGASFKKTGDEWVNQIFGADIMMSVQENGPPSGQIGFDKATLDRVRGISGVTDVAPSTFGRAQIDGSADGVQAWDIGQARKVFAMKRVAGQIDSIGDYDLVVDKATAKSKGWSVGSVVPITLTKGGQRDYRVSGIYESKLGGGLLVSTARIVDFQGDLSTFAFVTVAKGTKTGPVVDQIEALTTKIPLADVQDRSDIGEQLNMQLNVALTIIYVLLTLAVVIAFLGIINTLVLSVYERTRELGMLRAIGMARKQVKRMIRIEAVVMAVFGALLGMIIGLPLGYAVTAALVNQDVLTAYGFPGVSVLAFVLISVVAGVVAAWWPAFRASRLNVLEAISYE